jgi:hypothetical protein
MKYVWLVLLSSLSVSLTHAQTGKLDFVESGVTLRLGAPIKEDGSRTLVLWMQTNDPYECRNTFLENDVDIVGGKLLIKVKGVRLPAVCEPGMGPAYAEMDVTALGLGEHPVTVNINRQIFKAKMAVTETYLDFSIPSEDPDLFKIFNTRLNLIPAETIWGTCTYKVPGQKADALAFMESLLAAGATKGQFPAGEYEGFYLHSVGQTEEKVLAADRHEYPFVFHYSGDASTLAPLLQPYQGKIDITLRDAKGRLYRNF